MLSIEDRRKFAEYIVEVLNRALVADPLAVNALLEHRVPCNDTLADDPTVIVGTYHNDEETPELSALGLLNGFVWSNDDQEGPVVMVVKKSGSAICEFLVAEAE